MVLLRHGTDPDVPTEGGKTSLDLARTGGNREETGGRKGGTEEEAMKRWLLRITEVLRLLPELYADMNPMSYGEAVETEALLARNLRMAGYMVTGGH